MYTSSKLNEMACCKRQPMIDFLSTRRQCWYICMHICMYVEYMTKLSHSSESLSGRRTNRAMYVNIP